jgi:hypothetical protein
VHEMDAATVADSIRELAQRREPASARLPPSLRE